MTSSADKEKVMNDRKKIRSPRSVVKNPGNAKTDTNKMAEAETTVALPRREVGRRASDMTTIPTTSHFI
jgi:hypothetical protein